MQTQLNFRTSTLYSDLKQSGALLEYTPEAYARLKAIQGPIEKRRPENAHLRKLWDALNRAGNRFDGPACDRLEWIIKAYKERPEVCE